MLFQPKLQQNEIHPERYNFFGLVSIPIKLYSAVQESSLDLDMLDSRDHFNIHFMRVNAKTQEEVQFEKIVKGYAYSKSRFQSDRNPFFRQNFRFPWLAYLIFTWRRSTITILSGNLPMPLSWDEVDDGLQIKNFNLKNVPALLKKQNDSWKEIKTSKADLLKALKLSKPNT